jgi:hypothetical protein
LSEQIAKIATRGQLGVNAFGDSSLGKRERRRVGGEAACLAPEHIAGELVEHEDRRKVSIGGVQPSGRNSGFQLIIERTEPRS